MRKVFLTALFVTLSLLLQVKAVSDCTVVPSVSPDETWCSDCLASTKTNAICAFCNQYSPYANADGSQCSFIDCSVVPSQLDSSYCSTCKLTDKYFSYQSKKCIPYNCNQQAVFPLSSDFCWWCSMNFYPTPDGNACQSIDCSSTPSPLTNDFCNICQYPKNIVNLAKDQCVEINCDSKPNSGAYTDDWCQNCSNGQNANSDKSACAEQSKQPQQVVSVITTSGGILTVVSTLFILLIQI